MSARPTNPEHAVLLSVDTHLKAIIAGGTPAHSRAAASVRQKFWAANLIPATSGGPDSPSIQTSHQPSNP